MAAAPDGRIITGPDDHTAKMWRDGKSVFIHPHTRSVNAVAELPGGARLVSVSVDGTAKLWTIDGVLERTFEAGSGVRRVEALPDGAHFVVSLDVGKVRLYHVDGTLVHTITGHTSYVTALAVTHDGQHIISGSHDTHIKVWSVASKSLVSICAGYTFAVLAVATMPDGQRILSGGGDKTVRVWLLDGTLKNAFELHDHYVNAVALPDNQHALSGSNDITVKLFNVDDGAVLRTFKLLGGGVTSLALPDCLLLVAARGTTPPESPTTALRRSEPRNKLFSALLLSPHTSAQSTTSMSTSTISSDSTTARPSSQPPKANGARAGCTTSQSSCDDTATSSAAAPARRSVVRYGGDGGTRPPAARPARIRWTALYFACIATSNATAPAAVSTAERHTGRRARADLRQPRSVPHTAPLIAHAAADVSPRASNSTRGVPASSVGGRTGHAGSSTSEYSS